MTGITKKKGSYRPFSEPMKLLSHQQFIHFLDLNHWLDKAVVLNFFSENARNALRTSYTAFRLQTRLFWSERRFPVEYYASLGSSEVGLAIAALIRALDLPSSTSMNFNYVPIDVWEAKRNYDNCLNKLIGLTYCVDPKKLADRGIYSQSSFESVFGSEWIEKEVVVEDE